MPSEIEGPGMQPDLRGRAVARLTAGNSPPAGRADSFEAFKALYELAISPETSPRALALLHEIQVHQVELDLQEEELRRSRSDMEAALARQTLRYDHAPVGLFTVDASTALCELNLTGARMLGMERDALVGRLLEQFLTSDGVRELRRHLGRLSEGVPAEVFELHLTASSGKPRVVLASSSRDPAGQNFLLALFDVDASMGRRRG